jgi:hypothetical protein
MNKPEVVSEALHIRQVRLELTMSRDLYCWRCRTVVPMLDENEWPQLAGPLGNLIDLIKQLRKEQGLTLPEATKVAGREALARFRDLTGYDETNVNALWHHRLNLFGPPCATCGKPLRTPRAKHCAACGATRVGWRE